MERAFWKRVFTEGCIYFSILSAFVLAVYVIGSQPLYSSVFSTFRMLALLAFCLCFALANRILVSKKSNGLVRSLTHIVLTLGAFFSFVYAPLVGDAKYQAELNDTTYEEINVFVIFAFAAVIYAIGYGIYFAITRSISKSQNAKKTYKPIYSEKEIKGKKNKQDTEYTPLFKGKK